jgi:hypothetical protein
MIAKVVPSLKACFKDNEYKWNEAEDEETKFAFLIAIGGEIFEIADDFVGLSGSQRDSTVSARVLVMRLVRYRLRSHD